MPTLPTESDFKNPGVTQGHCRRKFSQMLGFLGVLLGTSGSAEEARIQFGLGNQRTNYVTRGAWVTATAYAVNDLVTNGGVTYVCQVAHTSGTFATDLSAGKWTIHQGVTREELSAANGVSLVGGAARVVDSIATLRILPKTGSSRAMVTGYYAANDGGGGVYCYDAADTTSADNGGTIIVAADAGRWKLAQSSRVTVEQFGAKGDWNGATGTDDYAAFSASLTALGYAFMTGRRYKIATGLTANSKTIEGPGTAVCELYYSGSGAALKAGGSDTSPPRLQGFRLTGTASATSGLLITQAGVGCRRGRFTDLYISGFTGSGVYGLDLAASLNNGIYYNHFERVNVIGCGKGARLYSSDGAAQGYRCNSNTFTSCDFTGNTGDGVFIDYAVGNTFTGVNRENNGGYGVRIDHTYGVTFTGGYSEGNTSGALNKTANATGVVWNPGRQVDAVSGTTNLQGDFFISGNVTLDESGNFAAASLKSAGGIGINNASALSNTLNFSNAAAASIAMSGANRLIISPTGSYFGGTGFITNSGVPLLINNQHAGVHAGAGSPEGAVNGYVGSLFLRTDGGACTTLYVKQSGSGNTGWVAK